MTGSDARRGPDRRRVLGLGLGGVAALAGLRPAGAQPLARTALGDGFVSTFSDGALRLGSARAVAPDVDPAALEALFAEGGLDPAMVAPPLNVTLYETGDRVILFDAGAGPRFQDSAGRLPAALEAAGIAPEQVTDILFTHAHPDHLGGVLDDFDELLFPEAACHIGRAEWEFWRADGALAAVGAARESFVAAARARFAAIEDRVTLIEPGDEPLPGVEAVASFGHTPGHLAYALHAGEGLTVVGDALAHPLLSFREPRWPTAMDQDPAAAAETRLRLLDRLAAERTAIVGYHLPEPGIGRVERRGAGYAFAA